MARFTTFLVAVLAVVGLAWAGKGGGKPGGGGGGGTPPPGTIYFKTADQAVYSMDGAGENVTSLPALAGVGGDASWFEHADGSGGAHRWFLRFQSGGVHGLYARRQDGAIETLLLANSSGVRAATGLEDTDLRWAKDDSFVSFLGTDATGEGLFVADVAFDASGVPYLASAPEALLYEDPGVLVRHDWAPTGDRFVVHLAGSGLHVGTISSSGVTITYLTAGGWPQWSPTDDRIAYLYGSWDHGVATIRADGSDYLEITGTPRRTPIGGAVWSPDAAFLAYGQSKKKGTEAFPSESFILVVPSTGGDATDITPAQFDLVYLRAWR